MILFTTERMLVRYFTKEDMEDLFEIFSDPIVMENMEPPYSKEKTAAFLQDFCVRKKRALAVVYKENDKVIGYTLFSESANKRVYELGWVFNRECWNQGLAYESMQGLFSYAFEKRDAHKLFAETIDEVKSVGLMKKLGMVHEGTQRKHTQDSKGVWRDLYVYGYLKEDDKNSLT